MKIQCVVERSDRQLPSLSMPKRRPQLSTLCIGQVSSRGEACILHQIQTSKATMTYKIKGNIIKCFTKFLHEGKATISFETPPHDLIIKVENTLQLKSFLAIIRSILQGKQLSRGGGGLSTLNPGSKMPKPPKTKMCIDSKADYPTLEGFPRTLLALQITGIEQSRFDDRILKLQNLRCLDLTSNRLKYLPYGLGSLPNLSELILKDNLLGHSSSLRGFWDWMRGKFLPQTLQLLDLSQNNISALPSFLRDMKRLHTLRIDSNQLKTLPSGIGRMKNLRYLSVSHNQLEFFPGSMISKPLDFLDSSSNPFNGKCSTTEQIKSEVLTLKELAARQVIRSGFPVTEADIPATVVRFMQGCDFCLCGSACFNPAASRVVQFDTRKIAADLIVLAGEGSNKPFRLCVCSENCTKSKAALLVWV